MDTTDDRAQVREAALSILGKVVMNDARKANAALQQLSPLQVQMEGICLYLEKKLIAQVATWRYSYMIDNFFFFELLKQEVVPFEKVGFFNYSFGGFRRSFGLYEGWVRLYMFEDAVRIELKVSPELYMIGTLICSHNLEELKSTIRAADRGMFYPTRNTLEMLWYTAKFHLDHLKLLKTAVFFPTGEPTLISDLRNFATAFPQCAHMEVATASMLLHDSHKLQYYRDQYLMVQGFCGDSNEPYEIQSEEIFHLSLLNGQVDVMRYEPSIGAPGWRCFPSKDQEPVFLQSLALSRLTIAGITVSLFLFDCPIQFRAVAHQSGIGLEQRMILKYHRGVEVHDVEVEFAFDDTVPQFDDHYRWPLFSHRLIRTLQPSTNPVYFDGMSVEPLYDTSVKLVAVRFRLKDVQARLETACGSNFIEEAKKRLRESGNSTSTILRNT